MRASEVFKPPEIRENGRGSMDAIDFPNWSAVPGNGGRSIISVGSSDMIGR